MSKEKDKYMLSDALTWIQKRAGQIKNLAGSLTKVKRTRQEDNRHIVVNICSPVLDKDFVKSSVDSISFETKKR